MSFLAATARHASSRSGGSHSKLLHWLVRFGALGVFGTALIDSSIFPLPVPGSTDLLMLILIAHHGNPWLLASLGVVGSLIGGFLTWSTGKKGGEAALQRYVPAKYLKRITGWVQRHGAMAVMLSTVLPPPMPLMPFLLAAGALGVSLRKFLFAFTGGRVIRYGLVAWLGVLYGHHMVRWWNRYLAAYSGTISWVIFSLFAIGIAWGIWQWKRGGAKQGRGNQSAEKAEEAAA